MQRLGDGVQEAWSAVAICPGARAGESRAVNDLHAFRIATKVLRYSRTELLYDVGAVF